MIDLIVDGLAAYRLTRLATTDKITEPVRDRMEQWSMETVERNDALGISGTRVLDVEPWATVSDLLVCDWCTSVWAAGLVLVLPRRARYMLAVAALAGITAKVIGREEKG